MNKTEVMREFRRYELPYIRETEKQQGGGIDAIMRREAWNNYTDMLCKDRQITLRQYESWDNPF